MAARTTPFSTYRTYLYKGGSKLVDIKDFTEPLSPREPLDTTVVSSDERTYRPGIRTKSKLTFTCNYIKNDTYENGVLINNGFSSLKSLEGTEATYSIYFGENGADGKFTFTAYLSVNVAGKGVNEVQEMVITLYPTSKVTYS